MTLLSDAKSFDRPQFWVLLAVCAALGAWSMLERRFDTFAAAVGYAYAASLACIIHAIGRDFDSMLWTVILSSGAVLAVLLWARARFKEAAS